MHTCVTVALLCSLFADDVPRALLEMERSRESVRRADIVWERTDFRGSFVPGIPKLHRSLYTEHEVAHFSEGTVDESGAGSGVIAWTPDGEPIYGSRYSWLKTANDAWQLTPEQFTAQMWEEPEAAPKEHDVKLIGQMPNPNLDTPITEQLRGFKDGAERRFREYDAGGLRVVECEWSDSRFRIIWHIDPAKGWNCVRARFEVDGAIAAESVTDYVQSEDGTWFPASVDYFGRDQELAVHIDVVSAQINSRDLPDRLTPDSIGFGSGFNVSVISANDGPIRNMKYVSDGRLASPSEYARMLNTGETAIDPRIEKLVERAKAAQAAREAAAAAIEKRAKDRLAAVPQTQPADEWEKYTYDFIDRFKLDAEQSQRAVMVLFQCQQRRDAYLKSRESTLADLGKELLLLPEGNARTSAERRLAALRRPIDEIFERQLKPRLEKLPTRKQRDAVGGPATQPVSTDKR